MFHSPRATKTTKFHKAPRSNESTVSPAYQEALNEKRREDEEFCWPAVGVGEDDNAEVLATALADP